MGNRTSVIAYIIVQLFYADMYNVIDVTSCIIYSDVSFQVRPS